MPLLSKRKNDAHEFQPILVEIEQEPTSPLARVTLWLVIITVVFFTAWSILGQVDVVVTAPGKVIPDGHAKILQPMDSGVVARILVKEGDFVHKGQLLMEIDPTETADELESTTKNYKHTRMELARIKSTLNGDGFQSAQGGDSDAVSAQQQLYQSARDSLQKQLESKTEELNKAKEESKETDADLSKNKELLALATTKRDRLKPVFDLIPRDDWEKNETDITTYNGSIAQDDHKKLELDHQQAQLSADIAKITSDFQTTNLNDLSQKQKDVTDLNGKVKELSFKHNKQRLVSPTDGYVDALYVHTVGGVVSPAEKLMSFVPSTTRLLVQTSVTNKDIGFVTLGMPVQLKVDTFDFQKYGMFQGKVALISRDSHDDEAKQASAGEQEQTEKKLDQVYEVYIQPTSSFLKVEGKERPLEPGMTLTAEINVGKRRIIEFFIYPLIKYWHEGITVR